MLQARITHAKNACVKIKENFRKAKEFLQKVEQGVETVKTAIEVAQAVITAAGSIPSGVIAGTANGFFTNYPTSIMEGTKMGMQLIEYGQKAMLRVEEVASRLQAAEVKLQEYEEQLTKVQFETIKAELERQIDEKKRQLCIGETNIEREVHHKKQELYSLAKKIEGWDQKMLTLAQEAATARVEQYRIEVEQATIELQIAEDRKQRLQQQARDLLFKIHAHIDEIEHNNQKIIEIKTRLQQTVRMAPPAPEQQVAVELPTSTEEMSAEEIFIHKLLEEWQKEVESEAYRHE